LGIRDAPVMDENSTHCGRTLRLKGELACPAQGTTKPMGNHGIPSIFRKQMVIERTVPSEATIQAELYWALKSAGFTPFLEQVFVLASKTRTGRPSKIRVDVLVARGHQGFAAIEVKNQRFRKDAEYFAHTRQSAKYRALGLPFRYCTTLSEIPGCVEWASSL
jgi:hypothetical protein